MYPSLSSLENLLDTMRGKHLKDNANTKANTKNRKLLLIAFHEPWCIASKHMIIRLEKAALEVQDKFNSFNYAIENNISPPIFGKMDTSAFNKDDLIDFFALFDNSEMDSTLPALKFVFIEEYNHDGDKSITTTLKRDKYHYNGTLKDHGEMEEQGNESGVEQTIIDFMGESQFVEDIVDTIMHYWYRFVLSDYITHETAQQKFRRLENDNEVKVDDVDTTLLIKEQSMFNIPIRPIFTFSNLDSLSLFVTNHKNLLFKPTIQDFTSLSDREEMYIKSILALDEVTEPHFAFVQCRETNFPVQENASNLYQQFDDLAQTYIYRRDVAFFVVVSDNCDWIGETEDIDEETGIDTSTTNGDCDGHVRTLKIDSSFPQNSKEPTWIFGNLYPQPNHDSTMLSMTEFMIVQSTPSVLWFDKPLSSSLAFPIYRKLHFVLFIDMHTPRSKDGSFKYSSTAYEQSKNAIAQLRETAIRHRQKRSSEDVVFLIVPSTEIQILTTFGIDIWTSIDYACSDVNTEQCYIDEISQLPMGMITSRRNSDSLMSRYYLPSDRINKNNDALDIFLSQFFDGKLVHQLKSEQPPKENKLSSGVQVLTGDTFEELVMLNSDKHSLVQFYAPYCGHCKRFNTIWNELAQTIQKLHWNSIIDVMIIDVTKNEVMLDKIDISSLPSVFLFPKDKKESPIEMKIQGEEDKQASSVGGISDIYPILEWIIDCNIFDDDELYKKIRYSV